MGGSSICHLFYLLREDNGGEYCFQEEMNTTESFRKVATQGRRTGKFAEKREGLCGREIVFNLKELTLELGGTPAEKGKGYNKTTKKPESEGDYNNNHCIT